MFRDRKPIGPIRRKLLYSDSEDSESDEASGSTPHTPRGSTDDSDNPYGNVDIKKQKQKNMYDMVENWRQSVRTEEAERRMVENYIRAYVDISDEEMEQVLAKHGF